MRPRQAWQTIIQVRKPIVKVPIVDPIIVQVIGNDDFVMINTIRHQTIMWISYVDRDPAISNETQMTCLFRKETVALPEPVRLIDYQLAICWQWSDCHYQDVCNHSPALGILHTDWLTDWLAGHWTGHPGKTIPVGTSHSPDTLSFSISQS